jgi:hypothetical protein
MKMTSQTKRPKALVLRLTLVSTGKFNILAAGGGVHFLEADNVVTVK